MTITQAESILKELGIAVALQHRFAFDTGTILRLEDYSMINIFDDGRYFVQCATEQVTVAFTAAETPWDPETWQGEVPRRAMTSMLPLPGQQLPPQR